MFRKQKRCNIPGRKGLKGGWHKLSELFMDFRELRALFALVFSSSFFFFAKEKVLRDERRKESLTKNDY